MEDNLQELVLTQGVRLGRKHLYPLSPLPGPHSDAVKSDLESHMLTIGPRLVRGGLLPELLS